MESRITQQNGIFLVEGAINANTALVFQNYLRTILNAYGELTINIENVTEIDAHGMNALRALYTNAERQNRPFDIIGYGCKEIYDDFRQTHAA